MHNTSLEISIPGLQILIEKHGPWTHVAPIFPKKRPLGPQNSSEVQDPKKLLKIVSRADTEKLKETMVGPQVE